MSPIVMAAVLSGALLHAGWNALIRGGQDRSLDTLLIVLGAGALTLAWLPWGTLPAAASWPCLAASVLIHVGYFTLVSLAYRTGELSFAYPLMRGTAPALSALAAATLLGEAPGPAGWLAIALISGGILLLIGEAWRGGSFLWRTAGFSLLNAAVIALYTLVDGVGARLSGAPASYTGGMILGTALGLLAIQLRRCHPGTVRYLHTHWLRGLLGGVCTLTAYTLALWAMTQAPIALVAALRETSVVFALFIATLLLHERWTVLRTLAALTVAAGGIILKLF